MKSGFDTAISIEGLQKSYASGFEALKKIDLKINRGEIFALLGPNGAGKTTLINIICGIVTPTAGKVSVDGFDIIKDYRQTRSRIGLVPQEIAIDMFEEVWNTLVFSRGIFGKKKNPELLERILKSLSLWDKKNNRIMALSGGMKRRVLIAKALAHEPGILFLDEPTAGVDVALRRDMWELVRELRKSGVTIILTTHYIEEAQEMADRIGIINRGEIMIVEEKNTLMKKLGKKHLTVQLSERLNEIPGSIAQEGLQLSEDGMRLNLSFHEDNQQGAVNKLVKSLCNNNIGFNDLQTKESSLEEIFVDFVKESV